jgi:site-specific DNA-methyltransferase (adenine-specific)
MGRRPELVQHWPFVATVLDYIRKCCDKGVHTRPEEGEQGGGTVTDKLDQVVQGDCLDKLKGLAGEPVDLAFADPPFNIGYAYDEYDDKRSREDYLDWSKRWMSLVIRVLKPDGTFWLAIGDEYAAELKVIATHELGLTCRNWVVWYYTFGVHCTHKFTRSHAHLFYFVKDPKKFTFNSDAIRVPSARQLVYADKRANPKGRVPDDTWMIANCQLPIADSQPPIANRQSPIGNSWVLRPQDLPDGFKADSDTWYFPRVCGTFKEREGFHGCQMPEQLLGRIIKACSNEGDLVLDPFAGSGTTLAVAKKLGRRYLGIELSEQYVRETEERLGRAKAGDPLDGVEDPLTSVAPTAEGLTRTAEGKRVRRSASAGHNQQPGARGNQMGLWT